MADVKDAKIQEAYEKVRSDKSPEKWLVLDYTSPTSSTLEVTKTGEGDYDEFVAAITEGKDRASYGYVRVQYKNDDHAVREKFVFVIWIGPETKLMRKARVSVHKNDVTSVLRTYSIEVPASSAEDLKETDIITKLRKAGGANYDRSNFA